MALLLVVVAAIGGVYVLFQIKSQVRTTVLRELQNRFPGLEIQIGPVQIEDQQGIAIHQLECHLPAQPGRPKRLLATINEIFLECPVTLKALIQRDIAIEKIILHSPVLRLHSDQTGIFPDWAHIHYQGDGMNSVPIEVRGGTILLNSVPNAQNAQNPQILPIRIADIACSITPPTLSARQTLSVFSHSGPSAGSNAEDTQAATSWRIAGTAKGDWFRQLHLEAYFNPQNQDWQMAAQCRQLDWTSDLLHFVPSQWKSSFSESETDWSAQLPALLQAFETFQGRCDLDFRAQFAPQKPLGIDFALQGIFSQGRLELPSLGRTLTELAAKFRVTDDSVTVEQLAGQCGATRFAASLQQDGLLETRAGQILATLRGVEFDSHLATLLSPYLSESTQKMLRRFDYRGMTDVEATLRYNKGHGNQGNGNRGAWKPEHVQLSLSNLNLSYRGFPYTMEQLAGQCVIDASERLRFELTSAANHPLNVAISGEYADIFHAPTGEVRIRGENVPINEKLLAALPEKQRKIIESLRPAGHLNAQLVLRLPPRLSTNTVAALEKNFDFQLLDVSVLYDRFPYPVRDMAGDVHFENDIWSFDNITGSSGLTKMTGRGFLRPVLVTENLSSVDQSDVNRSESNSSVANRADEFCVDMQIQAMPVDEQLFSALGENAKQAILKSLNVRGQINVDAKIRFLAWEDALRKNALTLEFAAKPCPGLSIHPKQFAYRIENLQGEIFYQDGRIIAQELTGTGRQRETRFRTGLECHFAENGQWRLRLSPFSIDQLTSERELRDALPGSFQRFIRSLNLENPINLRGSLELSKASPAAPLLTVWDAILILHNNHLHVGIPLKNIFGTVRLTGFSEDEKVRMAGQLSLDSVSVPGFQTATQTIVQATEISGPFFYDGASQSTQQPAQIFVGLPAGKALPAPPSLSAIPHFAQLPWFTKNLAANPLRGKLFGGQIYCESLVLLDQTVSYGLKAGISGASLKQLGQTMLPGSKSLDGTINAWTHFGGSGKNLDTLWGNGALELRNANVFEAPAFMRLLRELSIRENDPNAGAIKGADLEYRLSGNTVHLSRIVLEGGAFLLRGDGEMNLENKQIDLKLETRLGNRRTQIPVLSDLIGGASNELVQLQVRGPLSNPSIKQVVVPRLQQAFHNIQDDQPIVRELPQLPASLPPIPVTAPNAGPTGAKRGFFPW